MVAWFFGLLHRARALGTQRSKPHGSLLSDESLEAEIQNQLEAFSDALEADLHSLLEEVRTDDSDHPLSPAHLRNEVESDIFATGVGLEATLAILQEIRRKEPFDPQVYIAEVYVYLNIITLVQRCRATVRWATPDGHPERSDVASHLLEPIAIAARLALVRRYLSTAIALYYAGGDPARSRHGRVERPHRHGDGQLRNRDERTRFGNRSRDESDPLGHRAARLAARCGIERAGVESRVQARS